VSWDEAQHLIESDFVFEGYVRSYRFMESEPDSFWGRTTVYVFENLDIKKGATRKIVEIYVGPAVGSCETTGYLKGIKYRINAIEIEGKLHSGFCSSWKAKGD